MSDQPAQRRIGTPFVEDLSNGPKDTSPVQRTILDTAPTVRVATPIADILHDIRALLKAGLDGLKPRAGAVDSALTPNEARTLESLARTAKVVADLDAQVKERLGDSMNKMSDDQVHALAAELGVDVGTLLKGNSGP